MWKPENRLTASRPSMSEMSDSEMMLIPRPGAADDPAT